MVEYQNARAVRPQPRPRDPMWVTRKWGRQDITPASHLAQQRNEHADAGPIVIPRWRRVLVASMGWATVAELLALVALIWLPSAVGELVAEPLLIALVISLTAWAGLSISPGASAMATLHGSGMTGPLMRDERRPGPWLAPILTSSVGDDEGYAFESRAHIPPAPPVRGWWLIASGVAVIAALAAPLWIVPLLPDPVAAAAWVVVGGVIVNGAGMAIRAGVHGAPRGSRMAWMDGAGKVLSLIGWSSALVFVGFNTFSETSPSGRGLAAGWIVGSAVLIGGVLIIWGAILLYFTHLSKQNRR